VLVSRFWRAEFSFHVEYYLEDTEEVVEVFQVHVFDAKVVNDESELNGSLFVVPETGC
jgi:hypothetical protein